MNVKVRESSQNRIAGSWAPGCVSSKAAIPSGGEHFISQSAFVCQLPSHPALPRSAVTSWTLWCSCAQMYTLIIFSWDESLLSLHFRLCSKLFFCSVTLCKCWWITELSQEQISKIIVSDGVFTSRNCQCLPQIFKLARETSLHHRMALGFECVVGLSLNCPSWLTLKVPLLPHPPSLEAAFALPLCPTWNMNWICGIWKKKTTPVSTQASSYLLPTVQLSGSNSHSGMELRIWFRGGAGWAQDGWWGYCFCLSIHSCSQEAGMVVAELQTIFSLQLSTAKPGRTDTTREETRNSTSHMGILFRHTKIGCLHAGL